MKVTKKESIINLSQEMKKHLKADNNSHAWLIANCKSQSCLASSESRPLRITSMALNTFKLYCNQYVDGGFKTINELRIQILNKSHKKKKNTLPSHAVKSKLLEDELEKAVRARAILIQAYNDLNEITLNALSNNSAYKDDYEMHQKLYSTYFSVKLIVNND